MLVSRVMCCVDSLFADRLIGRLADLLSVGACALCTFKLKLRTATRKT